MKDIDEIKDFGTRKTGMKVPEGYFDDLDARLGLLLDEEESSAEMAPKITLWTKVKPYLYMAAMFVSFVVLNKVFLNKDTESHLAANDAIDIQTIVEENVYSSISDYDMVEYLYANAD